MGGILSMSSLACCLGGATVSAGCSVCSGLCSNSTGAKLMYALILLLTVVVSCIMLAPGVQGWLTKVPFCDENTSTLGRITALVPGTENLKIKCADAIGYLAVYRVCFIITLFFLLLSLIMIGKLILGVRTSVTEKTQKSFSAKLKLVTTSLNLPDLYSLLLMTF